MKIFKRLLLLVIFTIISIFSYSKPFEDSPKLISGKLDNGLEYYIYPNAKPEHNATLNLVVKTGSLMEENKEQGIAHFMEHMAFNGTTKYKKNDMIKYLQSIGLKFGGDLNAYTTFDKTVYKLQVPTGEKELEDGIEVLREWASEATLVPEEIDSEKKVIIEEWRLTQGLSQRLGDVQKKALFEGSRYYHRFPIGLPKIILGADHDLLNGFYKKWYQPQNMAVIAVGDFDGKTVENLIKKYFTYEGDKNAGVPQSYPLNKLKNKYITFSDPELRFNTFYITKILDRDVVTDKNSLRKYIIDELVVDILNSRLNNLTKEENSVFLASFIGKYPMTKDKDIFDTVAIIKNDRIPEGINLLNLFLRSASINGFTETELNLEKDNLYNSMKSVVANKDSVDHNTYAEELVRHVMYGESFIEMDKELALYSELLNTIKLSDLNSRIREMFDENSLYMLTTSTEQGTVTKTKIKDIIKESDKIKDVPDFSLNPATLEPIKLTPGKIVENDGENYVLSNGMEVYTKATDFDKDKIIIKLFKKEGSSVDNYTHYINSIVAPGIIEGSGPANLKPRDLEAFMKGKNFGVASYISDYEQGINIGTDRENLINALEYMSYLIYSPKVDSTIFNNTVEELKENIKTRQNSPRTVYGDEIRKLYSGDNKRRRPLSNEDINLLDKKIILDEFKDKFGDFSGYKLIIVGSIKDMDIPKLLEKYFASLPNNGKISTPKPLDIKVPTGVVSKSVVKGVDKKATTTIIFPYSSTYGYKEKTLYTGFSQILDMELIEKIREKIGGVYSIISYTSLSPNNYGEDKLIIYYNCDVNRINEIKKAVIQTLSDLLYTEMDQAKIDSVVKNYKISYDIQAKENVFWLDQLYQTNTISQYKLPTPEEFKELMTKDNLWEYNRKAINLKNYIDVTLIPEKDSL